MQKLAETCIRRPVFAAMIILALVVVGAASYARLGVDRFPSVDLPTVSVRTTLPGASAEEMESEVTRRIEEAVNAIEGIDELRSISGQGASNVIVTFNLQRNIDAAAADVRAKVAAVVKDLPDRADPPVVAKFDNDSQPVLTVALSGQLPIRDLTELADKVGKVRLERSEGVGEVRLVGGLARAINIWLDADRLAAYQLPVTAVRAAIARQNMDAPGGNVTRGLREDTLRTMGKMREPREFDDLVIASRNGASIRLRDVGYTEDGAKERRSLARLDGVPTVVLEVRRQSGANTVAVIKGVKEKLVELGRELPAGTRLEIIQDQSRFIYAALHEINLHLIMGSILACLVVLLFMRSWRTTVIAAVAIPASVIATFGMMRAMNFTLNSVTMLALVLMVGVVIDDAIVVLENIFRFIEEKRMRAFEAARAATADIGLAVMATTLSLVVIFIPVSFMSSISGRFLFQFGITAAVAVLVSLLVSFTLTPMMSARLLKVTDAGGHGAEAASRRGFYGRLDAAYTRALGFAMGHRPVVIALALATILAAVPLFQMIRQDYLPSGVDEGEFYVFVSGPQDMSLEAIDEAMKRIEDDIRSIPAVRTVLASAGGGFLGNVNEGRAYVRIAPHGERVFSVGRFFSSLLRGDPGAAFRGNYAQREVMQEIRKKLGRYRNLRIAVRNPVGFNIGGGSFDVDFVIRGPELTQLLAYTEHLREKSVAMGLQDADTTLRLDKPELRVRIDRERAGDLGVDTEAIATAVQLMVGGDDKVSRYRDASLNEDYDVQVRLKGADRSDAPTIGRLYVPRQDGGLVRLDTLVKIEQAQGASRIDRLDRQREARLRSSVAPGYALADRLEVIQAEVRSMNLPGGYTTRVSGRGRELERTFKEFLWAFLLSIIFMYMILASQFESLSHPFTILLSLPLAVPFALTSIWLAGDTLNLYSALGMLVLFGVVKKNAILQIDHMNNLRAEGMPRPEAIIQGNRDRLRPILMTTMTFVMGMVPLAIGTGPGAEERRAIAVVVIGGQTLSLFLTLLVTPVVYSYLDDLSGWLRRRRKAEDLGALPAGAHAAAGHGGHGPAAGWASATNGSTHVEPPVIRHHANGGHADGKHGAHGPTPAPGAPGLPLPELSD